MAYQDNLDAIKARIKAIPDLTETEREVLLSDTIIQRVLPIATAFVAENVTKTQAVKDLTGEKVRELSDKILEDTGIWEGTKDFLDKLRDGIFDQSYLDDGVENITHHWFFGPIATVAIIIAQVATMVTSYVSVTAEKSRQIANKDIQPFLLDLPSLVEEVFRHPQNYAFVWEEMRRMGITDKKIEIYLDNQHLLLPLEVLKLLWNRGLMGNDEVTERLKTLKIHPDDIPSIKDTFYSYPGPGDLVRFAVREVFSEELASQLGLFEGLPEEFVEAARKTGIREIDAKRFWGAHWNPPSLQNAFTMFHRGVISREELEGLLKVQDYMPNYRDKLVQIAYQPITRVDIRRLYRDQAIEYEEMVLRYEYIGYAPNDAILLANWTESEYGEETKERTKADVLRLFKLGSIGSDYAINLLINIGYPEEIAEEFIERVNLEIAEKKKKDKLKLWKKGFVNDFYTESKIRSLMGAFGMETIEIEDIVDDWKIEKSMKLRLLTPQQLEKIYAKDLLSKEDILTRLVSIGYTEEDALLLRESWS